MPSNSDYSAVMSWEGKNQKQPDTMQTRKQVRRSHIRVPTPLRWVHANTPLLRPAHTRLVPAPRRRCDAGTIWAACAAAVPTCWSAGLPAAVLPCFLHPQTALYQILAVLRGCTSINRVLEHHKHATGCGV
ncbi:hypothetical protein ABBQ32_011885 [Trebouxia sp. C0010 RCD-2024]